jgi:hypothetical protein
MVPLDAIDTALGFRFVHTIQLAAWSGFAIQVNASVWGARFAPAPVGQALTQQASRLRRLKG